MSRRGTAARLGRPVVEPAATATTNGAQRTRSRSRRRRAPPSVLVGASRSPSRPALVRLPPRLSNTSVKLRSGARVNNGTARAFERRQPRSPWCRRKLRQLHRFVRPRHSALGGWISAAHATPTGRSSVPGHAVSCRPFPNGTRPAWSDIARHAEPPRLWTQMNSHILYVVHAAACGATDAQASDDKPDPFRCATVSLIENACLSSGRGASPSILPDCFTPASQALPSRGPKREPDRAAGARHHPLLPSPYCHVGRTLAISCEAVPASIMGRRGHEPAPPAGHGAGESFVSFIALFDSPVATSAA